MNGEASFIEAGYVYIMTNRAYPGLCKIGCTARHPVIRARELSNTSCPYPFTVAWAASIQDFAAVERATHRALEQWRVCDNREFFRCDVRTARIAIERASRPWLGRRLWLQAAASSRQSKGGGRSRKRSNFPEALRFCFCVSLALLVLVEVAQPRPAAWWPVNVIRAVWFIEHIPHHRF